MKKSDKTKEFLQTGGAKERNGWVEIELLSLEVKIVYLFQNSELIIIINIINNRKKIEKKIQSVSAFCVCKILHFAFKMKLK